MQQFTAAVACCLLAFQIPLAGWNEAGHRAIAFLAWSHLNQKAKARVSLILRAHPDFSTILNPGPARRPSDVDRYAFLAAASWPDVIRGDSRFSEQGSAKPLPGFPDMRRHTTWHFVNTPVPAAFANEPVDPDNGAAQLPRLIAALRNSGRVGMEEAYALPWIIHIVSDLHQPLHAVARFSKSGGKVIHDLGGNGCFVEGARNLHSLWDGLLGTSSGDGEVARLATSLQDEFPVPARADIRPASWVREGVAAAEQFVYAFDSPCGDRDKPAALPPGYHADASALARQRAALAAYRLAAILNQKLGR